jgi:hypothetical protein
MRGRRRRRFATILPLAVLAALVSSGCRLEKEPEIAAGIDGCAACGMVIEDQKQAAAYYLDREFLPFCSTGCLLQSYEKRRKAGQLLPRRVFIADYLEGNLRPAESMSFLLTESLPTVMEWGILAFSDAESARAHRGHEKEVVAEWLAVRALRGIPDRTVSVTVDEIAMEPEVVDLVKGELVLWEVRGDDLDEDLRIRVRGYEELGDMVVPVGGESRRLRILATKPGEGFPVVEVGSGRVLGRFRVKGPHLADEEGT